MIILTPVRLTNNEKVWLARRPRPLYQNQTFVRIGKRLIAEFVDDPTWQGIHIWQEGEVLYHRLVDIVFVDQEDGSVIMESLPITPDLPV